MDKLEQLRERVADGDKDAIMDAMYLRIREVGPAWLTEAFSEIYETVRALEKRGWDDALGGEPNKGKHLDKSRLKRKWAIPVYAREERKRCKDDPNPWPDVAVGRHFERTVAGEMHDAVEKVDLLELRDEMRRIVNKYAAMAGIEVRAGDVQLLVERLTGEQLDKLHTDLLRLLARSLPANL
jgi:hypothetical protein